MTLSIHHRLKPFCHTPGTSYLLPGSGCLIEIYPCRLVIKSLLDETKEVFDFKLSNFYQDFTVEVDYLRRFIRVFGHADTGFIEYKVFKADTKIIFKLERYQDSLLQVIHQDQKRSFYLKEEVVIFEDKSHLERLHKSQLYLGFSKKQDIDVLARQKEPKALLPYILFLGESLHVDLPESIKRGFVDYLNDCDQIEKAKRLEKILSAFFSQGLIPEPIDLMHRGFTGLPQAGSALFILKAMSEWIKEFLIKKQSNSVYVLDKLPREFISGRVTSLDFDFGKVHLEWTKGFIRKMILDIQKPSMFEVKFPKEVKSFRLKKDKMTIPMPSEWTCGLYYFDNFLA